MQLRTHRCVATGFDAKKFDPSGVFSPSYDDDGDHDRKQLGKDLYACHLDNVDEKEGGVK